MPWAAAATRPPLRLLTALSSTAVSAHGVEKRSHVRSRIIANALCDLIKRSDSVIIMGHRMSDLDAVGSAIGVLRICKMCDVPAVIAINSEATLAGPLLKTFLDAGEGHDFITPDQTLDVITPNTLLIVVDTYQKRLLESQQIYEKCKRVVVIDHHRMAVGHIDNPTLIYHEPYASSASELVCELLQFMPKENQHHPAGGPGTFGRHHAGHPQLCAACRRAHL